MKLTVKQRQKLKGLGHNLDPVVQIGKDGITDGVAKALDGALEAHELVKVKLGQSAPDDRHQAAEALARRTKSELVQVLGKVILLYRRHPEEPKIAL